MHLNSFQQLCAGLKVMLGEEWGSDRVVFAIIFSCCHLVCYTCINGCFGLLDYNGWLQEYKLGMNICAYTMRYLPDQSLVYIPFNTTFHIPLFTFTFVAV